VEEVVGEVKAEVEAVANEAKAIPDFWANFRM
jgi:hypothetical protein